MLPPTTWVRFQQIEDYTKHAMALKTVLINIQFAVKDDTVYIIEANPRVAHRALHCEELRRTVREPRGQGDARCGQTEGPPAQPTHGWLCGQIPVFSYSKFPNVNKEPAQK